MDRPLRRLGRGGSDGCAADGVRNLANRNGRAASGQAVSRADETIERLADKLQQTAERAAAQGGLKAKLAEPLAEDAAFLRKLKPSLIAARARGEAPTDQRPSTGIIAPSGPQLSPRPKPRGAGGPNPLVVVGIAFAVGILLARVVDWRGHAHPRH